MKTDDPFSPKGPRERPLAPEIHLRGLLLSVASVVGAFVIATLVLTEVGPWVLGVPLWGVGFALAASSYNAYARRWGEGRLALVWTVIALASAPILYFGFGWLLVRSLGSHVEL